MCGICGFYDYKSHRPAQARILNAMLEVLRHRGPDDWGTYLDKELAIGMRRLSIIDLEGGKQPLANEDRSIVTVFNGEIYNYQSLRGLLESRGHRLTTRSDTEVIVHLYEDHGEECVQHLRGMFAFAIWDARSRRLFLARDRLGIKPLYFTHFGGRLIFASEIKAILQHPAGPVEMNTEALTNFLSLKYVPAPQTMFKGIYALPPGCSLLCNGNGIRLRRYWDLSFTNESATGKGREECYAEQLAALLQECVKIHLVSDVPFGAFLSGGLDSSTIVALMSEFLDRPVKTFSVGFEGDGQRFSELPHARVVAEKHKTDHHEIIVRPVDLVDLAEKIVWHLDQPLAEHATLANYLLAEHAARQVKMVLTGEGGDELFAGYARYAGEMLYPFARFLPKAARSLALAASLHLRGLDRAKIALYALNQPNEATRFLNWFPLFNSSMKQSLLSEPLMETLQGYKTEGVLEEHLARSHARAPLHRMLYLDTKLWLPDVLLARADKMSMAASLESRVPLLDHKLVEFAASLPPNLKVRGLARKYLLKKVSRSWVPQQIIQRKKEGFPTPTSLWLRHEARAFMRDILSPSVIRVRGLFNPTCVERLIREHENGSADHGAWLWGLISLEIWQRLFMNTPVRMGQPAGLLLQRQYQ
jgi:asparagine synthase (glutamine-hydrolysing)